MTSREPFALTDRSVAIVTMHGKEQAIAPVLAALGLRVVPGPPLDTDRFGTFTRERARPSGQWETALAKAREGSKLLPEVDLVVSSEGAFGPHPQFPLAPAGIEMVCLLEVASGQSLMGLDIDPGTNFGRCRIEDLEALDRFAATSGFPRHGLVVLGADGVTVLAKGVRDSGHLRQLAAAELATGGMPWVETDMRAHMNPTRMQAIGRATLDLARRLRERCPNCRHPGWEWRPRGGRPCGACGQPTSEQWKLLRECHACGHLEQQIVDEDRTASPGRCPSCNP